MKCEKCGTVMLPTGEMLRGFPFVGCPNCGSEETKQKIHCHSNFIKNLNETSAIPKELIGKRYVCETCGQLFRYKWRAYLHCLLGLH